MAMPAQAAPFLLSKRKKESQSPLPLLNSSCSPACEPSHQSLPRSATSNAMRFDGNFYGSSGMSRDNCGIAPNIPLDAAASIVDGMRETDHTPWCAEYIYEDEGMKLCKAHDDTDRSNFCCFDKCIQGRSNTRERKQPWRLVERNSRVKVPLTKSAGWTLFQNVGNVGTAACSVRNMGRAGTDSLMSSSESCFCILVAMASYEYADSMLSDAMYFAPMIAAARLAGYAATPKLFPHSKDFASTSDNIYSFFYHSFITYLAMLASCQLCSSAEHRFHATSRSSYLFLLLYTLDTFCHIPVQLSKKTTMAKNATVLVHHALSNICFLYALLSNRMHFFAVLAGICEITNPPLSLVFFLKELGLVEGPYSGPFFKLTSIVVWLSFLIFRMILFPAWFTIFIYDMVANSAVTQDCTLIEICFFPCVIIALMYLSYGWMVPLTQGLVRVVIRNEVCSPRKSSEQEHFKDG